MVASSYINIEMQLAHGSKTNSIILLWPEQKISDPISMRTHTISYNVIGYSRIVNNMVEGLRLLKINSFYP